MTDCSSGTLLHLRPTPLQELLPKAERGLLAYPSLELRPRRRREAAGFQALKIPGWEAMWHPLKPMPLEFQLKMMLMILKMTMLRPVRKFLPRFRQQMRRTRLLHWHVDTMTPAMMRRMMSFDAASQHLHKAGHA